MLAASASTSASTSGRDRSSRSRRRSPPRQTADGIDDHGPVKAVGEQQHAALTGPAVGQRDGVRGSEQLRRLAPSPGTPRAPSHALPAPSFRAAPRPPRARQGPARRSAGAAPAAAAAPRPGRRGPCPRAAARTSASPERLRRSPARRARPRARRRRRYAPARRTRRVRSPLRARARRRGAARGRPACGRSWRRQASARAGDQPPRPQQPARSLDDAVQRLHDRGAEQAHAAGRHQADLGGLPALGVNDVRALARPHHTRQRQQEACAVDERAQTARRSARLGSVPRARSGTPDARPRRGSRRRGGLGGRQRDRQPSAASARASSAV